MISPLYVASFDSAMVLRKTAHKWILMSRTYAKTSEQRNYMLDESKRCLKTAIWFLKVAKGEKNRAKTR